MRRIMKHTRTGKNIPGIIAVAVSAVLITAGLLLGQYSQVLTKAIRVCLECIGIG